MTTAWFAILVVAALGLLFGVVDALQRRGRMGAEAGRKTVHIGMGFIGVLLPWFFRSPGPVWLLCALAAAFLGSVRMVPAVGRRLGKVLGGVERTTYGDMFYPLGVAAAFTLSGEKAAFCAAVGTLAFGDTAGAIVGPRWGRLRYAFLGCRKSLEGSCAVLLTCAVWTGCAMAFLGGASLPSAAAGAVLVSTAAALIEAASWCGLDNLLLPVAVVWLVRIWLGDGTVHRSPAIWAALGAAALLWLTAGAAIARAHARAEPEAGRLAPP